MFLLGRPILHIVDESTRFTATCFLKNKSSSELWKAILLLWIHTYLGPPDYLSVDQGSAYTLKEFKGNVESHGITLREALIETPGAISVLDRYHAPIRSSFTKIRDTITKDDANDDDCFKMAAFAVNSTIGPEGLFLMLLTFEALPRPARTTPAPNQLLRQRAIDEARTAAATEQAKSRLASALNHQSSPRAKDVSKRLHDLPRSPKVLVYRTASKPWEGPFRYVSAEGETGVV